MAILRKQRASLWEYIREAPRDWVLHLVENYELLDWNKISEATSWPVAVGLNGLFVLVSTARQISLWGNEMDAIVSTNHKYRSQKKASGSWGDESSTGPGATWSGILLLFQLFLFSISLANTWWFFNTRRAYQMRMKDDGSSLLSSSCRRVRLGTRRPQWAQTLWGWAPWMLWKWIAGVDDKIQGEIWELSLWIPSTFSRNLFCWYSPVQLLILAFMNGSNWFYILPLAAAVAGQCTFLVFSYTTLVKDKQILFGEVYNEYNQKFVHPRVFAPKRDVATSTSEDWALARRGNDYLSSAVLGYSTARSSMSRMSGASVSADEFGYPSYLPRDSLYERPSQRRSALSKRSTRDSGTSTIPVPYSARESTVGTAKLRSSLRNSNTSTARVQTEDEPETLQQNVDPMAMFSVRDRLGRRRRKREIAEKANQNLYY
ncbi:hypothetical protein GGI07_000102 [Coemansia sp. Benny D115]|nr:hypothetical protein GGI07_000102 [Coemansia sp. Benny D115]